MVVFDQTEGTIKNLANALNKRGSQIDYNRFNRKYSAILTDYKQSGWLPYTPTLYPIR